MKEIKLGRMYKLTDKQEPYIITYIVPTDWATTHKERFKFLIVGSPSGRSNWFRVSSLFHLYRVEEAQNEW